MEFTIWSNITNVCRTELRRNQIFVGLWTEGLLHQLNAGYYRGVLTNHFLQMDCENWWRCEQ